MYCYMARQPILDAEKNLYGYELLFRDGVANCFPNINADEATSKLITEHHLLMGVEKITGSRKAFINFSADTLIHHFPTSIDPKSMVIEILETVPISRELLTACRELHRMGYQLALDDHDFEPKWDIFLPYVSIIKVDVQQFNMLQISKYISRIKHHPVTLLAEKVETAAEYQKLKQLGFSLFQGYFFARPEMLKHKQISGNKANLLALMAEASASELNFEHLANICQQDVGLSFKLLRFINHAGASHSQPISSLKHAMIYMGEAELKKFIALLALANLQGDAPTELLRQSLVRARFSDMIASKLQLPANPPSAFLTGLFSNLHLIVEQSQPELLAQLPLLDDVKRGLLKREGDFGHFLRLAEALEQADWPLTDTLLASLPQGEQLAASYLDAVSWTEQILAS